jgi:hypothetical protein
MLNKPRKIRQRPEELILLQVVNYLKLYVNPKTRQRKEIMFRVDYSAGMKMSLFQAKKMKRFQSARGFPDIVIFEPCIVRRDCKCGDYTHEIRYCGLAIEIKAEDVYRKRDGLLSQEQHIQEQEACLSKLRSRGFKAEFGIGFEGCRKLIDAYFKGGI